MTAYLNEGELIIRPMEREDPLIFHKAFLSQGWQKPLELFEDYYAQQMNGKRKIIVAEVSGEAAGYVTLLPKAVAGPFAAMDIPEIVDFNVLTKYQRRGIGSRIMDVAEKLAGETSGSVSLSVGMHYGYGSAQRMYVKRGYIPDGTGVWYQESRLEQYAPCANDDDLVLYMKKELYRDKNKS